MISVIKKCFVNGEKSSDSITRSAFLIAALGIVSRLLGLLRDRILAAKYGAGDELDIYYAAFKIPDLIYSLLVLGALSAAFIPVFSALISEKKEKEAWQFTNSILTVGVFILTILGIFFFILAPFLIKLITFGFSEEKKEATIILTRIMLLSPIILGVSGIIGGILNSFKKFFFYSLAPVFYNIGIIIGVVFFTSFWKLKGLALGVVLGSFLHFLIQLPEIIRSGFIFKFSFNFKNKHLRKVGYLMLPRLMGLAVTQINLLAITVLASTLESGSLAIFNFANNLQSVPLGLFSISFAIASFPTLSCLWVKNEKEEFANKFLKTFRRILFFLIPSSLFIFLLRAQIVRLILGSGKFNWEDTNATLDVLGIFCFSLFAQGLIPLLARTFYAIQDTRTPFFIGVFSELINIGIALFLIPKWKLIGLVWAFNISVINNFFWLFFILMKKSVEIKKNFLKSLNSILKIVLATFLAGIFVQIVKNFVSSDPLGKERTLIGILVQLIVSLSLGLASFAFWANFLKIEDFFYFLSFLKKKRFFSKKNLPAEDVQEEIEKI